MIKNRIIQPVLLTGFVFALLAGLSIDGNAQRRSNSKRSRVAAAKAAASAAERKKGAEDVAIQVKNVSKFVFVLGGIATGIEEIDKDIKEGNASREVEDKNKQFKNDVIRSIRALRAGLVKLEIDFRTKPALKPYLIHIQGIIGDSAEAEDLALAGQFNQSGKQLLLIVETLADVLVAMP